MKKIKRILTFFLVAGILWSIIPILILYFKKDPVPFSNRDMIEKIKENRGQHFGFIVYGDTHSGVFISDSTYLKLIRHANLEGRWGKLPIDFVAVVGDVTNRGTPRHYKIYNKLRAESKWPVLSLMGNHDVDHEEGAALFERYIGEKDFSFVNRNSYFIALDNGAHVISDEQFQWLEEELKKSQHYKNRFVMLHRSPISASFRHDNQPEVSPWAYRFMKLCEHYQVDIVFAGHEHFFKEHSFGGVKYVVTGGAGMPLDVPRWEGGYLNYVVVRVNVDYIDYEIREVFPPLWRFFTITISQDIFYFLRDAFFR